MTDTQPKLASLNEGPDWAFSRNEKPKCPHCGEDFDIAENEAFFVYDENNTHTVECMSCKLPFWVNSFADWRFSTDVQDDQS